jgi:hypothetical protein
VADYHGRITNQSQSTGPQPSPSIKFERSEGNQDLAPVSAVAGVQHIHCCPDGKDEPMKSASMILLSLLCAACSGMDTGGMSAQQQSSRNLCEAMRSYQPYRPGDCPGYGMRSDGGSRRY